MIFTFNRHALKNILIYLVLFLYALNFNNLSAYLIIILFLIVFFKIINRNKKITLNLEFFFLLICFISYFFNYLKYNNVSFLYSISVYFISPILAYLIGLNLQKIPGISTEKILYSLALGYFVYGFLNFISTPKELLNLRQIINYWSNDFISATLQGSFYTLISSMFFYGIIISKKRIVKLISVFTVIFSIYASIESATRTLLIIFFVVFLINILLYIKTNKIRLRNKFVLLICILFVFFILIVIYINNWMGIQEIISTLPINNRTDIESGLDTPRYQYVLESLKYVFHTFQGGGLITKQLGISYIHNMWLDTVNTVGLIPAILLIVYSISTLINICKLLISKTVSLANKHLFISLYIAFLMECFVEPILEGIPYFFASMCFINGLVYYFIKRSNKKNEGLMDM